MTLKQIRDFVYTFTIQTSTKGVLGNPSGGVTGDQELNTLINQCQASLFEMIASTSNRFFHKTDFIDEVSGETVYDLPTDLYRTLVIERVAGGGVGASNVPYSLRQVNYSPEEFDRMRATPPYSVNDQTVEAFVQVGQKQIEFLNPTVGNTAQAFKVRYIFRPADMVADGHVPFQSPASSAGSGKDNLSEWHDIIAWRALEMALIKELSPVTARVADRAARREQELRMFLGRVGAHRPRMTNFTRNGDF